MFLSCLILLSGWMIQSKSSGDGFVDKRDFDVRVCVKGTDGYSLEISREEETYGFGCK